jgi:glycosyltransferase involved in cell wall biosynthesis
LKISIITITYNSEKTVEETIRSVIGQDYPEKEYIIIDGASKDGTLAIVNKYREHIATVVSEKDNGLYDALNKGIAVATGDIIGMLHSDDLFAGPGVLSKVADVFNTFPETEAMYADLVFTDRNDTSRILRVWKAGNYEPGAFKKGWMPPHPTFFVRKAVYERFGVFNTGLKLSADYELMLRLIHKHHIKVRYLPEVIVTMRMGGISNHSLFVKLKANLEDKLAWKLNGIRPGLLTTFRKPLLKLKQYLLQNSKN